MKLLINVLTASVIFVSSIFPQIAVAKTKETEVLPARQIIEPVVVWTKEVDHILTEEEIDLIALVTMAEAEGEDEYGKRLVIDTILNRVKSDHFPDTVEEVIYQPNAFEAMWNGRVDICYVDEDICELVREEMEDITDEYVYFFCAGDYSKYGEPMYQVGNHYFSTY